MVVKFEVRLRSPRTLVKRAERGEVGERRARERWALARRTSGAHHQTGQPGRNYLGTLALQGPVFSENPHLIHEHMSKHFIHRNQDGYAVWH